MLYLIVALIAFAGGYALCLNRAAAKAKAQKILK